MAFVLICVFYGRIYDITSIIHIDVVRIFSADQIMRLFQLQGRFTCMRTFATEFSLQIMFLNFKFLNGDTASTTLPSLMFKNA